ncbi:MAG: radical SAM protein [Thermodesulfovibrionales bacterium]
MSASKNGNTRVIIKSDYAKSDGPLRVLLVKPQPYLLSAKRLKYFLNLEPLELEIVAGAVPDEDVVAICDLSIEEQPAKVFHEQFRGMKPHIVGFTGYSTNASQIKELAHTVKTLDPSVLVVVGGIHATIAPADYALDDIDIIVRGEGGTAFKEIIRRFKAGLPLSFGQVSLSPMDPDFAGKAGELPPEFPDIKDIPLPRRDIVRRSRYFSVWTSAPENKLDTMFPNIASVRTSYGCKFNCSFCVVHFIMRRKYFEREPEDVVNEIENIREDHIYFVDDETFLNEKRMTEVANLLIQRGIKKKYVSWARADTITKHPDLFRLWKKAGLAILYVGIEAMDDSQLKGYNKHTSKETNMKAIALLREIGITLHASLMVNPDFTDEDFKKLHKVVRSISPAEVSFTVFSPSPGTELWHQYREAFICKDPYLFYDCMHTLLPTRLGMNRFYAHFSRLYRIAWSANPLRVNKVRVPFKEILRAIHYGTKYIFALRNIYKDYR